MIFDGLNMPELNIETIATSSLSWVYYCQKLVVGRDQRNQKKAHGEDFGRRARPTESKESPLRRCLQSLWVGGIFLFGGSE